MVLPIVRVANEYHIPSTWMIDGSARSISPARQPQTVTDTVPGKFTPPSCGPAVSLFSSTFCVQLLSDTVTGAAEMYCKSVVKAQR